MTVGQYLARVAAEATTIINAQDYGRTIYDMTSARKRCSRFWSARRVGLPLRRN